MEEKTENMTVWVLNARIEFVITFLLSGCVFYKKQKDV